jgi:tetratricopeptide (TPR) repeat protein
MAQGKHPAAQPLLEKSLRIRRRLFDEDHPDTAESYNDLAETHNAQAKYADAQPLFEKALEIFRRHLGDNNVLTAIGYNNVGMNLGDQGKYAEALPLLEKSLRIRRRLFGDDHPLTATSFNNVGYNLNAQGKYAEAQPFYEKALEIRRHLLGDDHPVTAESFNNVGYNLNLQGKYAEARPLYEKALEIRRKTLGENHPRTAQSYNNVAGTFRDIGLHGAAQPLYEKALEIYLRLHRDDHPDTAVVYNNLAKDLDAQGKSAEVRPLLKKALDIRRRLLGDDHPETAVSYQDVAANLNAQGKYAEAQKLFEQVLGIRHRLLTDDHPRTAQSYGDLARCLHAQGKYLEALDRWQSAAKSQDTARLRVAFTGLERAGTAGSPRLSLAALLARLGRPEEAWEALEGGLGRGLLDELAARRDRRLTADEAARLRDLTAELERLDRLAEAPPRGPDRGDQVERGKQLEELRRKRELASIALGEFQSKLAREHDPVEGRVAGLAEARPALPADAALVAWVDLEPAGQGAADPDGEHWGAVLRARGTPAWVRLPGTGAGGHWAGDDAKLPSLVRAGLSRRPGPWAPDVGPLVERLRAQRLKPLAGALGPTPEGLPAARRLIVLPSAALAGIPVEAILEPRDRRVVSYAPSATVLAYLRGRPPVGATCGLLALGDPVFEEARPQADHGPLPDHGLLLTVVVPNSNAAGHGLRAGDVLLSYDGRELRSRADLKAAEGPGPEVAVDVWRGGQVTRRRLGRGKLGAVIDPRPAPAAIAEQRRLDRILTAARSGSERFGPLPGTRLEAEALARSFAAAGRPARLLTGTEASEPELERLTSSGDLGRFAYIHLATHGVVDEATPARSAVVLTQTGLPDSLDQVLHGRPVYDGRLSVREIQRGWELDADLVTLSACETARGRYAGGEGFVGFAQALLMSGARGVCLSLWKVDDVATALLMGRFYANLLGREGASAGPMPRADALAEARGWLRSLGAAEAAELAARLTGGADRGKGARRLGPAGGGTPDAAPAPAPAAAQAGRPYEHPYYWAAFVLIGDPG